MFNKKKCDSQVEKPKKKTRKSITLGMKHEILSLHRSGMKVIDLANTFGLSHSTVSTILKYREKYLNEVKNAGPMKSTLIRKRRGLIAKMEKLLIIWMNDRVQRTTEFPGQSAIAAKALSIFEVLKKRHSETAKDETFIASKGWFDRFKKRSGLFPTSPPTDEPENTEFETPSDILEMLAKTIDAEGYCPRRVFNVDEVGLFWKRRFAVDDKNYSESDDRVTLLLGSNAIGDLKIKPMIIHHSDTPKTLNDIEGESLPFIWRSNPISWMTASTFKDWFLYSFIPEVEKYCSQNDLPFKALLILDCAPSHPPILENYHPNVKVFFLPANKTALYQPMDQGIAAVFKAYYLLHTFDRINRICPERESRVREFWDNFSMLTCIDVITQSWNCIDKSIIKDSWKKIYPGFEDHSNSVDNSLTHIVESIIFIANLFKVQVSRDDVIEFLDSHTHVLSDEDLMEMEEQGFFEDDEIVVDVSPEDLTTSISSENQISETEPMTEKVDPEETKLEEKCTSSTRLTVPRLLEAFDHLDSAMEIFKTDDPSRKRSSKVLAEMKNAVSCYRDLFKKLQRRKKQRPMRALPDENNMNYTKR